MGHLDSAETKRPVPTDPVTLWIGPELPGGQRTGEIDFAAWVLTLCAIGFFVWLVAFPLSDEGLMALAARRNFSPDLTGTMHAGLRWAFGLIFFGIFGTYLYWVAFLVRRFGGNPVVAVCVLLLLGPIGPVYAYYRVSSMMRKAFLLHMENSGFMPSAKAH